MSARRSHRVGSIADKDRRLWAIDLAEAGAAIPLVTLEFAESAGNRSPDGRFLTFVSDETGRFEV